MARLDSIPEEEKKKKKRKGKERGKKSCTDLFLKLPEVMFVLQIDFECNYSFK